MKIFVITKDHNLAFDLKAKSLDGMVESIDKGYEFLRIQNSLIPIKDITLIISKDQLIKVKKLLNENEQENEKSK